MLSPGLLHQRSSNSDLSHTCGEHEPGAKASQAPCVSAGQSKGFCYVSYATREEAGAAMEALNGAEYPQHCGQRMKARPPVTAVPACLTGGEAHRAAHMKCHIGIHFSSVGIRR